jgi:hypothetical protein
MRPDFSKCDYSYVVRSHRASRKKSELWSLSSNIKHLNFRHWLVMGHLIITQNFLGTKIITIMELNILTSSTLNLYWPIGW